MSALVHSFGRVLYSFTASSKLSPDIRLASGAFPCDLLGDFLFDRVSPDLTPRPERFSSETNLLATSNQLIVAFLAVLCGVVESLAIEGLVSDGAAVCACACAYFVRLELKQQEQDHHQGSSRVEANRSLPRA